MDGNEFIEEISKLSDPPVVIALAGNIDNVILNSFIREIIQKPVSLLSLRKTLQKYETLTSASED